MRWDIISAALTLTSMLVVGAEEVAGLGTSLLK